MGTLVERKTRFVVMCKMEGNTAAAALDAFSRQMKRLVSMVRRTSNDHGRFKLGPLAPGTGEQKIY